ncbi:MAG: PEGA domain-containing protein, partial [Desulfobacterales bacterium]|nr:PEGA domain-containing protein [Desulfobacterales bacterium]
HGYDRDNRLLFYFSGHGHTRQNGEKGYLVPADAPNPKRDEKGFLKKALPMSWILAWSRQIEARHALFLFDSCFSGAVFKAKDLPEPPPHITRATRLPVRQYITAGDAGETVPAKSVFTPAFIDALKYRWGDLNRDGYVCGTELGLYLQGKVSRHSNQTPQYGKIRDYDLSRGDFIFLLEEKPETGLRVETEPSGGKIFIDGKPMGVSPLAIDGLSPGRVTVRVEKRGFEPAEKPVRLRENKQTEVKFKLVLPRKYGSLAVESDPGGAEWYLDGDYVGTTPDEMRKLTPGEYRILFKKDGYEDSTKTTRIHAGKREWVDARLKRAGPPTGVLYVKTEPKNARVKVLNSTTKFYQGMELEPARYHIEASAPGYKTRKILSALKAGEETFLHVRLEKETAGGGMSSSPPARTDPPPTPLLSAGKTWSDPETGMEFAWIPGGCFEMGSPDSEKERLSREGPVHEVCVDGFWIGKYEVTNAQYRRYKSNHDSKDYKGHSLNSADQPAVRVSWKDAKTFIQWINKQNSEKYQFRL